MNCINYVTVHRDYANKSCPGTYLYSRMSEIAAEVNRRLDTAGETSVVPYCVRVDIPDLNIRKGPGTNYAKTGMFTGKGVFTIVEVRSGSGSVKGWGRLKSGAGWVSLDYTVKV